MGKQFVSVKQGIFMMVMYILGTTFLVAPGIEARRDAWLAYLLALAVSILLVLIYGRILDHFPGKDMYETLVALMGRRATVIVFSVVTVFIFQHYSYILRSFGGFINIVGLPEAPVIVPLISLGVMTALAVYIGIEVLGKWTVFFLIPTAAFIIFTILMLTRHMDMDQLGPILENGIGPVMKGTWTLVSLPFAETVAFLYVLPPLRHKGAAYKIYIWGLLIGFAMVFLVSMTDILVLGVDTASRLFYPSLTAMSIIKIGKFIKGLEVIAASVFTITVFFKASILLLAIIKNLGRIFELIEPRILVVPLVSLSISYAINTYQSGLQFYAAIFIFWPLYSSIFQVLIPILLCVFLEYRMSRHNKLKEKVLSYP